MTATVPGKGKSARSEIALVAEQLWPSCTAPQFRAVEPAAPTADWTEIERHRVAGRGNRIDLVLPLNGLAAARSLMAYSRLRPLRLRVKRAVVALTVLLTARVSRRTIALEMRADFDSTADTVVRQLRESLGADISITMPVRRAANRKALLQLVDGRGVTVGFAKLARNKVSAEGIRNETVVLRQLEGGSATVRTPRVLVAGECGAFPYVVTEPLPRDIRGVTPALAETPSIAEFAAIAPIARMAQAAETQHLVRMRARASKLHETLAQNASGAHPLLRLLDQLLRAVESYDQPMPVGKWWHGDFAFWNVGRTPDGVLWCWDFENLEHDALAGLDVLHWHASRRREARGADGVGERQGILSDSMPILHALGLGEPRTLAVLFHTYIAEIMLRTLETVALDGWSRTWTSAPELQRLATRALAA